MKSKSVMLVLLATLLTTPGQIFFKMGAQRLPQVWTNWPLFLAVLLYGFAGCFFIVALRSGNLTRVYPIFATSYIWVTLAGKWVFHDAVRLVNWVGIVLIICGVCCVAFGDRP